MRALGALPYRNGGWPGWPWPGPLPRPRWIPNTPSMPAPPVATAGSPVPAGFPTNQLFMAPDGSQWAYSTKRGKWVNVGTPFDLSVASNPPSPSVSSVPPAGPAPAPVSVTVEPSATGGYQSLLNFATQSSLISGIPNWIVGVGLLLGFKLVERWSSGGSRRNPSRYRVRRLRRRT